MKIVYFTHSLTSCWNHGNAHFLRGVLRNLVLRGHEIAVYEPGDSWSLGNLVKDHGEAALSGFRAAYPELISDSYGPGFQPAAALDGADVVIVHEWTEPKLVADIGKARAAGGRFALLFHDTHHRAVSDPEAIRAFDLEAYDGVLAFGEALAQVYRRWGWGRRAFVWHEAADVTLFKPPAVEGERSGLVWIGNWGDGERTEDLETFLLAPAQKADLPLDVYGVRYPPTARALLDRCGARYRGWLANHLAPRVFAERLATVHVPRSFYVKALPGIPTIRVFEALACGIPLACAPWDDAEHLFRPGQDYLLAQSGEAMANQLRALRADEALRRELGRSGLETILARHTCAHRVTELLSIVDQLHASRLEIAG